MQFILKHILFIVLVLLFGNVYTQSNTLLELKTYLKNNEPQKVTRLLENKNKQLINQDLKIQLANAYYQLGNVNKATNIFLQINADNAKLCNLELAKCYALLFKPTLSCKYLQIYLQQINRLTISQIKSDKVFRNIDSSAEWINLWKKNWYSKNELLLNDALYEYNLGHYSESINLLDDLTQRLSKNSQIYELLALNYKANNQIKRAISAVDKALKIKPKSAKYLFLQGELFYVLKKYKKSLSSIDKSLEQDSSNVDVYLLKAKTLVQLREYEKATILIDKILIFDNNISVFSIAGGVYYANGNYLQSLKYYNKAIECGANNPSLYIDRGDVYFKSGVLEFAEKDYSMALDFFPTNGEIFYKRAIVRSKQKRYESACSDLKKAKLYGFTKAENEIRKFCR